MSKFPVEVSDSEGQVDAINYLLSGPSGLGQNFQGVSAWKSTYLTGFYRKPFTVTNGLDQPSTWTAPWPPQWYFTPINITNAYPIDVNVDTGKTNLFKIEFATQSVPPFMPGQAARISGVIDIDNSGFYDDYYNNPGVQSCTTDYVIIKTQKSYVWPEYVSGGIIYTNQTGYTESTDCNARIFVTGGTDTVFISSQNEFTIGYTCSVETDMTLLLQVNRYYGFLDTTDPTNPDYKFLPDDRDGRDPIVSQQTQTWTVTPGSGTLTTDKYVFSTVLDQNIPKGYYWYICEITISPTVEDDAYVTYVQTGLRSMTCQVIKQ